jgi:hypothetical protein
MQMEGIAPWPLDVGAEWIHDEHSIVRQLTKSDRYGVYMPAKSDEGRSDYVFWSDTNELADGDDVGEADRVGKVLDQVSISSFVRCPGDPT